jgi:hypothetical protein
MRWTAAVATVLVVSLSATAPSSAQSVPTSTTTLVGVAQPPVKLPPLVQRHFPALPHAVGCYRFHAATTNIDAWRLVPCATPAYIEAHFPDPEVLSGVFGGSGVSSHAAPFALSVLSVHPVRQQLGLETDSQQGTNYYSLQDNAFFTGTNGVEDGVQFTVQKPGVGSSPGVCVWQVDIPAPDYNSNCATISTSDRPQMVEGTVFDGILTVGVAFDGCCTAVAVEVPDMYGLGHGDSWDNSSGSILGYGNGSEAVFTDTEEAIDIQVSSCLDDGGFIGYSVFCEGGKLKPNVSVAYSPGPSTNNFKTKETNNLLPVIGSPPGVLPTPVDYSSGGNVARIYYVASSTGSCLSGKAPFCT